MKQNKNNYVKCLSALHGFEWAPDPSNNTTLHACVGGNITMKWNYTTQPHEAIVTVFWLSANTPIAIRVFQQSFHPLSSESFKAAFSSVTFTPEAGEAGVTLHHVTSSAAGPYSVQVLLSVAPNPDRRTVNLILFGMYDGLLLLYFKI
jgi:hypothetical protein